jgi:protein ImuA
MNKELQLATLRHVLARHSLPLPRPAVPLGHAAADAVLGGGLRPGAVHEVFAGDWGAGGFAILMAVRLAAAACGGRGGPLFWVRSDYAALEYGALSPTGLAELGGDPQHLVLLRAKGAQDALAVAADILACPHVGCLLLEMEANPRVLDLTASRRLALAAEESGVSPVLLREGARPEPGAAHTRWRASSLASPPDDDDGNTDWGNPRFAVELVRHRLGGLGKFLMEWDSQAGLFVDPLFVDPLPAQLDLPSADTSLRHPPPLALRARGRGA